MEYIFNFPQSWQAGQRGTHLVGKTFIVDPITKQRFDNMGEEEKYYIKDHHEPIVSKEIFEKAQAIRNKRNCNMEKGRLKRYSRQYTFSSKKELSSLSKELSKVEDKIKKLIDLHINGAIDRENYENKFIELNKDKERLIKETNELSLTASEEKEMKTRLKSFRKYFDANKPLKKFDVDVFESIVEKIILGGIDDKGQKDPHQLTFVFKTGPKPTISMGKDDESVNRKGLLKKGKELYSQSSAHTCGVCDKSTKV